jgi:hypothetical protein
MPFGFGEQWVKAEGLVVASREIGSKVLGTWRKEWVVEVRTPDGQVFRSAIRWPFSDRGFWPVSDGRDDQSRVQPQEPRASLGQVRPEHQHIREDARRGEGETGPGVRRRPRRPDSVAGLDPELAELYRLAPARQQAAAPAADGKIGLEFQFAADGRPAPGQVQNVVGAVVSGQMRTIRGKADELLATGTHGTAVVTSASPLGKTVRDINPNADPSRLNDPMWLFTVEVSVAGENPFPAVFGHRVPLAKLASIAPGVRLAIAVNMANRNNEVAIDWERSPLP